MRIQHLSKVAHTYVRLSSASFVAETNNDTFKRAFTGLSKDGFLVRSRPTIRDLLKLKEQFNIKMVNGLPVTIEHKEIRRIKYNNKLMGIGNSKVPHPRATFTRKPKILIRVVDGVTYKIIKGR